MLKRFSQAIERIEGQIRNWSALSSDVPSDLRYLVAVSGGVDSMCLADLCLKNLGPSRFAVAHCNFHLRGDESDGDEALVASWVSSNGVEYFKADFDTETYAAGNGVSIEMAARDLRYGWFAELCNRHGFAGVMTAHNANDNAETLILNLLRGSGLHGVCGMEEISRFDSEQNDGVIVLRPVLTCTRKQIEGYAFAWKIPYRTDSTNALSDYKRNRIRNEVFPQFEKINPSFVQTLNREMKYFTDADDIVEDWCREHAQKCLAETQTFSERADVRISIRSLLSEPRWRYLLYYILSPYGFNSAVLASVEDLLISTRTISGKRFESDTHTLLTERDELVVVKKESRSEIGCDIKSGLFQTASSKDAVMVVRGAGIYHFNGSSFTVEVLPWTSEMSPRQPEGTLVIDAGKLSFPFVCRCWKNGDWFKPLGLKGKKKVSDLFADLKYDRFAKDASIMLVNCRGNLAEDQHIAGILGLRIDDAYKVTSRTKQIIRMKLQ
jgi:tRNA(Ile)-lysidine synthase